MVDLGGSSPLQTSQETRGRRLSRAAERDNGGCVTYPLTALSPLDGRYRAEVTELEAYFSEAALFRYRARVEIEYLIFLTKARDVTFVPKLDVQASAELRGLYRSFRFEDAER